MGNSLGCERECFVLLEFWETGQVVRSHSGPEVKILGVAGGEACGNEKAPTWGGLGLGVD